MAPKTARRIVRAASWICTGALLLGVLFSHAAHGGSGGDVLSPAERLWLSQNQSRLVLAVETGYAPFVFLDAEGRPTGLAHELLQVVESRIGVEFRQKRFASLDEIFEGVRAGEVHVVNAVTKTPARSEFLRFTEPFISVPNVILMRKDSGGSRSEAELSGLTVSLVKSYAVTEYLTGKGIGLTPDLVPNDLAALLKVSFGQSDAAVVDLATASYLISTKGITNLQVVGESALPVRLAIGVAAGEPELHGILQKAVGTISETDRRRIQDRWISVSGRNVLRDWRFWAAPAALLLAAAIVLLVNSIWNNALRREVRERTADLTAALNAAQAANRELEEFSYSLSHDMRAPLRAIDGYSAIVLEEHADGLDAEGRRLLAAVRRNARHMERLIDDILDFLRIRNQRIAPVEVDLSSLAKEVFAELTAPMPDDRVRLAIGSLPPAWCDREMMREVLRNLLSNAIKFAAPDRDALIEITGTGDATENAYCVKDNGVGFDMDHSARLFSVFERAHPTGQYEGTGIGLAIVKRILERHGGRVWADGSVGEGARFHFALPRRPAPRPAASGAPLTT